jgi:hypothetical protein
MPHCVPFHPVMKPGLCLVTPPNPQTGRAVTVAPAVVWETFGKRFNGMNLFLLALLFVSASYSHAQVCSVYDVTINGQVTFSGAPAAPPFAHRAFLYVTDLFTPDPQTTNGPNPADIGFFTLDPANPFLGVAGALYFATNTSLSEAVIPTTTQGSGIDLAFVAWEPTTQVLSVAVDETRARLGVLNIFNATTGVTAQIHNVLAGMVEMQFSPNFANVGGTILLGGSSGFAGPGMGSEYQAQFSGGFLQSCLPQ